MKQLSCACPASPLPSSFLQNPSQCRQSRSPDEPIDDSLSAITGFTRSLSSGIFKPRHTSSKAYDMPDCFGYKHQISSKCQNRCQDRCRDSPAEPQSQLQVNPGSARLFRGVKQAGNGAKRSENDQFLRRQLRNSAQFHRRRLARWVRRFSQFLPASEPSSHAPFFASQRYLSSSERRRISDSA